MSIIFLNGCTSAGKTSIATALQDRLVPAHLRLGIDDAFAMVPRGYHDHPDGFFFDCDDRGEVRLNVGSFGMSVLRAHQRAAAAIAAGKVSLILDQVVFRRDLLRGWLEALEGIGVLLVGVRCDLPELERRERRRGDRVVGQARGQFNRVHAGVEYDLEVDTTSTDSAACAEYIAGAIDSGIRPIAFGRMQRKYDPGSCS